VAKPIPQPMESGMSHGVVSEAAEPAFRQLPCWRWSGVSMVGVAALGIREYLRRKESEEKKHEQLELNLPQAPSRGLHQTAPSGGGS
jgi:hypothetical protein